MKISFLPNNLNVLCINVFKILDKDSLLADSYTTYFYQFLARTDNLESSTQFVSHYIDNLCLQFQDALNMFDLIIMVEAHQHDLQVEMKLNYCFPSKGGTIAPTSGPTLLKMPQQAVGSVAATTPPIATHPQG